MNKYPGSANPQCDKWSSLTPFDWNPPKMSRKMVGKFTRESYSLGTNQAKITPNVTHVCTKVGGRNPLYFRPLPDLLMNPSKC